MSEPKPETPRFATRAICLVAAGTVSLQLASLATGPYGTFIDEFYYYACTQHLAWGYVDHPPLSIFVLWIVRNVFGESLLVMRAVAALCGGITVILAGAMAQRMGAARYGQLLAAVAIACTPLLTVVFGFYSMNAIEVLIWSSSSFVLVGILHGDQPSRWWKVGLLAGLGLLNKHTMVVFCAGLAAGLLATSQRRVLKEPSLWIGVAIGAAIALPNLLWQVQHDWVSLEFYRNASEKNLATSPIQALVNQVLALNPGALPIWAAGAWALLRNRRLRPLGILFALLFVAIVLSGQSRQDRIAGAVPLVMAAGAAYWDGSSSRKLRAALLCMPLAVAAVLSPVFLPVLPPAQLARYAAALGVVPEIEAHDSPLALPQWFADRIEWEDYVRAIEDAYATLSEAEKDSAIILTRSYGGAGPLELLGRGLPPVYALHNNYHLWGPPEPFGVAIVVQFSASELSEYFESVTQIAEFQCQFCRQWRHPTPIFAVRRPIRPIAEIWDELLIYR